MIYLDVILERDDMDCMRAHTLKGDEYNCIGRTFSLSDWLFVLAGNYTTAV
jgi:hypothetical protein